MPGTPHSQQQHHQPQDDFVTGAASAVPSRDSVSAAIALVRANQMAKSKTTVHRVKNLQELRQFKGKVQPSPPVVRATEAASSSTSSSAFPLRDPLTPVNALAQRGTSASAGGGVAATQQTQHQPAVALKARGRDPSVVVTVASTTTPYEPSSTSSGSSSSLSAYLNAHTRPTTGVRGVQTPQTSVSIPGAPSMESEESGVDDPSSDDDDDGNADDNVKHPRRLLDERVVDDKTLQDVNAFLDRLKIGGSGSVTFQNNQNANDHDGDEDENSVDAIETLRMLSSTLSAVSEDSSIGEVQPETLHEISAFIDSISKKEEERLLRDEVDAKVERTLVKMDRPMPEAPQFFGHGHEKEEESTAAGTTVATPKAKGGGRDHRHYDDVAEADSEEIPTSGNTFMSEVATAALEEARKLAEVEAAAKMAVAAAEQSYRKGMGDAPSSVVMDDPYNLSTANIAEEEEDGDVYNDKDEPVVAKAAHPGRDEEDDDYDEEEGIERDAQTRTSRPSPIYELLESGPHGTHRDPPSIMSISLSGKADPPGPSVQSTELTEEEEGENEDMTVEEALNRSYSAEEKKSEDPNDNQSETEKYNFVQDYPSQDSYDNVENEDDDDDDYDEDDEGGDLLGSTGFVDTSFAASLGKTLSTVQEAASAETDWTEHEAGVFEEEDPENMHEEKEEHLVDPANMDFQRSHASAKPLEDDDILSRSDMNDMINDAIYEGEDASTRVSGGVDMDRQQDSASNFDELLDEALADSPRHMQTDEQELLSPHPASPIAEEDEPEHGDESSKEPPGSYQNAGVEVESGFEQTFDDFHLKQVSSDDSDSQGTERYATLEDGDIEGDTQDSSPDVAPADDSVEVAVRSFSEMVENDLRESSAAGYEAVEACDSLEEHTPLEKVSASDVESSALDSQLPEDATSVKSSAFSDSDSVPWALKDIASEETMRATGRRRPRFVVSGPRPSNKSSRQIVSLLSDDTSAQYSEAISEAIGNNDDDCKLGGQYDIAEEEEEEDDSVEEGFEEVDEDDDDSVEEDNEEEEEEDDDDGIVVDEESSAESLSGHKLDGLPGSGDRHGGKSEEEHVANPEISSSNSDIQYDVAIDYDEDSRAEVLLADEHDEVEIVASFLSQDGLDVGESKDSEEAFENYEDQAMGIFENENDEESSVNGIATSPITSDDKLEDVMMDALASNFSSTMSHEVPTNLARDPSGSLGRSDGDEIQKPDPDADKADDDDFDEESDDNGIEISEKDLIFHTIHDELQVRPSSMESEEHLEEHSRLDNLSADGTGPLASSPVHIKQLTEDDAVIAFFQSGGSVEDPGGDSCKADLNFDNIKYDFVNQKTSQKEQEAAPVVSGSFLDQFDDLEIYDDDEDGAKDTETGASALEVVTEAIQDDFPMPAFEMGEGPLSPTKISEFFRRLDSQPLNGEEQSKNVQHFQQLVAPLLNGHKPTLIETAQIRQAAQKADVPIEIVDEFLDYVNSNHPGLALVGSSQDEHEQLLKDWDEIEDLNEDAAIAAFLSRFGGRADGEQDLGEEVNLLPAAAVAAAQPQKPKDVPKESVDANSAPRLGAIPVDVSFSNVEENEQRYVPEDLADDVHSCPQVSPRRTETDEDEHWWKHTDCPTQQPQNAVSISQNGDLFADHPTAPPAEANEGSSSKKASKRKNKELSVETIEADIAKSASFFSPRHYDNNVWQRRAAMATYGWGWEEAAWLSPKNSGGVGNLSTIDGVAAVERMSSHMFNKRCFPFAKRNWKMSYRQRTQSHGGYFDVDVHSLQEAAAYGDGMWPKDETPWEHRQVRQRFLHEKSLSFSRNWFGEFAMERGNDKIKAPVCRPKSMEMPMENIPDPGDWTEEWYTTWNNGKRQHPSATATETNDDSSRDSYDDESESDSDSFSSGGSSAGREDEDDDWEEPPECGTLVNVKQKIGERITRVHPDYTSSLRRSRWRKKYFPKGTFPY